MLAICFPILGTTSANRYLTFIQRATSSDQRYLNPFFEPILRVHPNKLTGNLVETIQLSLHWSRDAALSDIY